MSHPLIASLGVACVIGALPLAAGAVEDTTVLAANPLQATNVARDGFKMLRIKATGSAQSATRMTPVIYGPDFIPNWQMKGGQTNGASPDTGASKLEGHQFRFR